MKILVVGSGGREHALAWKLAGAGHTVLAAPGNPGIARVATCLDIAADDVVDAARRHAVDLVVIGPEAPLVAGLGDRLRAAGVAVFGPGAAGARLEGSKVFCKELFARHGIATARFFACSSVTEADRAIAELGDDVVVKADGLAAGKGVIVCSRADDARAAARLMLAERRFGDAGRRVIIEERLRGHELSVMAITDGERLCVLAQVEDHKALRDGDRGPNTGGMGAVSPCPWVTDELIARIERDVFMPTLRGLAAEGIDYRGVLYAGLMIDAAGTPWALEYNCRFGDPETQVVLPRLAGDLGPWLVGAARGRLPDEPMRWLPRAAVCVILASAGYPAAPETGKPITGALVTPGPAHGDPTHDDPRHNISENDESENIDIENNESEKSDKYEDDEDVLIFHAGTALRDGCLVSAGGRVLGVTALGVDVAAARRRAYDAVAAIHFDGMHARTDIGARPHGNHDTEGP